MDIDRVRYFHAFANSGSLVRAAEILHISQPALSKALRLLETEVGLKLMQSEGRGLRLTEAGQRFRKETSPLLADWLAVPHKIQSAAGKAPLRLGSFEVFTTYFLGTLMAELRPEHLELYEFMPGRLEDAVAGGIVDIGITYVPVPKAGVEFLEITKIKMGIFGHPSFAKLPFASLPFVAPLSPLEGTPSKVVGLDGWPDHKYKRSIKFRVTMMESALELCRSRNAVAYLPKFVVELHNQRLQPAYRLSEISSPLPEKARLQGVFLVRRPASEEGKTERQIARCLRALA